MRDLAKEGELSTQVSFWKETENALDQPVAMCGDYFSTGILCGRLYVLVINLQQYCVHVVARSS